MAERFIVETTLQTISPQGDKRRVLMIAGVGIVGIDFAETPPDWKPGDRLKVSLEVLPKSDAQAAAQAAPADGSVVAVAESA